MLWITCEKRDTIDSLEFDDSSTKAVWVYGSCVVSRVVFSWFLLTCSKLNTSSGIPKPELQLIQVAKQSPQNLANWLNMSTRRISPLHIELFYRSIFQVTKKCNTEIFNLENYKIIRPFPGMIVRIRIRGQNGRHIIRIANWLITRWVQYIS